MKHLQRVAALKSQGGMSDNEQSLSLGLLLMNLVGRDVLKAAVVALRPHL
jgi:hypothetical protein